MKILSIVSSPRKKGSTEAVVRSLERALEDIAGENNVPIEIEHIQLAFSDIQFCKGCRVCFEKGEEQCPLKDGVLNIRDKMNTADGIIAASPVYVEDVNGIMKNWIDRMAFNCHRPPFEGKSAALITTSGIGSSYHALNTMGKAFQTWGIRICAKGSFKTGAKMEEEKIRILYSDKIENIAKKLFSQTAEHKQANPSFYSLIVFRVQQKYWTNRAEERNTFDYSYWENHGWLKEECDYYIPHDSNMVKRKLARLAGDFISQFFN